MRWDIFCTVVDNFGDIGFCWRLARQLSSEHHVDVRLWVDNLERLSRFCPLISTQADQQFAEQIEIRHWSPSIAPADTADVVIEAFACHLPPSYIDAMDCRAKPPVWINLEYLTAEDWVEGCHLLTSPQSRSSLKKTFFFPGFTKNTGGLLRERNLLDNQSQFDRTAQERYWRELGLSEIADRIQQSDGHPAPRDNNELTVSLFCFENSALRNLLEKWAFSERQTRLLAATGQATEQIADWLGQDLQPGMKRQRHSLTVHALPFLSQDQYDRLLWSCDLNFVRGEDSFVRAQWAQRPFIWQIYPQSDNAHLVKLDAFLSRYLGQFKSPEQVRRCWLAWNGVGEIEFTWQDFMANLTQLEQHGKVWVRELDQAGNLADNLVRFVFGN